MFDDERQTQDIVFRACGTFTAYRYDKARSRRALKGQTVLTHLCPAVSGKSSLGRAEARPGSQFWPQQRGLSSSPASPPRYQIPPWVVGLVTTARRDCLVATGGAIQSHSGMSCSEGLQGGDVG